MAQPPTRVQTFIFSKDHWTVKRAQAWARKRGYRSNVVGVNEKMIRLRQLDPTRMKIVGTFPFGGGTGIQAVVGTPKGKRKPNPKTSPEEQVLAAVRKAADPTTGLVEIPAVVRACKSLSIESVHEVLLELSRQGLVELSQWSSPDLASQADKDRMIRVKGGRLLGYVEEKISSGKKKNPSQFFTLSELQLAEVTEGGVHFKTGKPVTIRWLHNTEKAPNMGSRYQQDIEPAGLYINHLFFQPYGKQALPPGWETGEAIIKAPLVLVATTDTDGSLFGPGSWKNRLHLAFGAKNKGLSKALRGFGFDAIVTVYSQHTGEIVLLKKAPSAHHKVSSPRANPRPIPLDSERVDNEVDWITERTTLEIRRRGKGSEVMGTFKPPYYLWSDYAKHITPLITVDRRKIENILIRVIPVASPVDYWVSGGYGYTESGMPAIILNVNGRIPNSKLIRYLDQNKDTLKVLLRHELTHARDVRLPPSAPTTQTVPRSSSRTEAETKAYFNRPAEVRAYGQNIADQALMWSKSLTVANLTGREALGRVLTHASELRHVYEHLTPANRRKVLLMLERTLRDAGIDTSGGGALPNPNPNSTIRIESMTRDRKPQKRNPPNKVSRAVAAVNAKFARRKKNPSDPKDALFDEDLKVDDLAQQLEGEEIEEAVLVEALDDLDVDPRDMAARLEQFASWN